MGCKHSILVVEDDPQWQMIYEELLDSEKYLLEIVGSKAEAERKLGESDFDVAIIDLRLVDSDLDNKDGLEVVRLLRELHAPTQVIVKSGYLEEEISRQLEELGVFSILDKSSSVFLVPDLVAQAVAARGT
jgi:CheY-like chemotaxis protein